MSEEQVLYTGPEGRVVVAGGTMIWDGPDGNVPVSQLSSGQVMGVYAVAAALMGAYEAGARGCSSFGWGMINLGVDILAGDWGAAVAGAQAAADCVLQGLSDPGYVDEDGLTVYE